MKLMILFITVIWFCFSLVSGVEARRQEKQQMPKQDANLTEIERKEAEKRAKQQAKEEERQRKEEEKRAKQQASKGGCLFTPVSPIPEGNAVIYLYKAWYGKDVYPIAANGRVITHLQKGGYFPFVTPPGKVGMFMTSKDTGSGTFFSNPAIVLDVEAGKEYYLKLTTTFSAKLKLEPEKDALKSLKDMRRLLAYATYMKQFADSSELMDDPVLRTMLTRGVVRLEFRPNLVIVSIAGKSVKYDYLADRVLSVRALFRGGQVSLQKAAEKGPLSFKVEQMGYAESCADRGVVIEATG